MFAARQNFYKTSTGPLNSPLELAIDTSIPAALPTGQFRVYITVPVGQTATIDWFDGSPVTTVTGTGVEQQFTKTYSTASFQNVKINGQSFSVRFNDTTNPATSNTRRINFVSQWGTVPFTSMAEMFAYSDRPMAISALDVPNLSICTSLRRMFFNNTGFNQVFTGGALFDSSNVTDMSSMFEGATSYNRSTVLNTSNVTNMSRMFARASSFNQDISTWNTSNVTNMSGMFQLATGFNRPIGTWNTGAVTDMSGMFQIASAFNQNISGWNTGAVTNMSSMFSGATAFNQNISGWNTGAVTNMSSMFTSAATFNQPIGTWNTGAVTTMRNMFNGATAFNGNISTWNTGAVTNMAGMFSDAIAFDQPIGTWNTGAVTDMSGMFQSTGSPVFNQNLSAWITGLTSQPGVFSAGANATWVANKATLFPFLSDGVTRVNT